MRRLCLIILTSIISVWLHGAALSQSVNPFPAVEPITLQNIINLEHLGQLTLPPELRTINAYRSLDVNPTTDYGFQIVSGADSHLFVWSAIDQPAFPLANVPYSEFEYAFFTINTRLMYSISTGYDGTNVGAWLIDQYVGTETAFHLDETISGADLNFDGTVMVLSLGDRLMLLQTTPRFGMLRTIRVDGDFYTVRFSPNGEQLAVVAHDETEDVQNRLRLYDVTSGRLLHTGPEVDTYTTMTWSHDGTRLAAFGDSSARAYIQGFDIVTIKPVASLPIDEFINDIAWSMDDRLVLVATRASVYVFDGQTGEPLASLIDVDPDGLYQIEITPDSRYILGSGFWGVHVFGVPTP